MKKPNVQDMVKELAEKFIDDELDNMLSVSNKVNQEPGKFILSRYPGGIYSFLTVNGDLSVKYLKDHMPVELVKKLTNKHYDSFIRMVDEGVNKQFRWYLESSVAA